MSHFAEIKDGVVVSVIVAEQEHIDTLEGEWVQTSYNTFGGVHYDPQTQQPSADQTKALRKNYAIVGGTYNSEIDAFVPPPVYQSWILNTETCLWEAPIPEPTDGKPYMWDESTTSWVEMLMRNEG